MPTHQHTRLPRTGNIVQNVTERLVRNRSNVTLNELSSGCTAYRQKQSIAFIISLVKSAINWQLRRLQRDLGRPQQPFFNCSSNPANQFVLRRFIAAEEMSTLVAAQADWLQNTPAVFHCIPSLQGNDHEQARR